MTAPYGRESTIWKAPTTVWRRASVRRRGAFAATLLAVFVVGILVGRAASPGDHAEAVRVLDEQVLPLVVDADGIWTAPGDGRPAVAEALVAIRRDGDPQPAIDAYEDWIAAYDSMLVQIAGVDVPSTGRAVQRQFIAGLTLSRDAVEVLAYAATLEPGPTQRDLTTEVGRLRRRSEQMTQAARASIADLAGQRADVAPPPSVPAFDEARR